MTSRIAVAIVALLLAGSCGNAGAGKNREAVYQVKSEDADMNAAKREARASLPAFYSRLANPAADESEFMVKFDILPGDGAEFVWADNLDRSAKPMTGVLVNQPEYTDDRLGERVPIAETDIIDWSYRKGRVTQGGFTNRVLLQHMPPDEAAKLRDYLGW